MPGCGCLNNSVCPKCGRLKTEDSCLDKSKGRWSFAEWQVSLNLRWIEHSCRRFLFGYWGWWQDHHWKAYPWQTVRRIKDIQSISKLSQMPRSASRTAEHHPRRRPKRRGRGRTLDWKSVERVGAVVFCNMFTYSNGFNSTLGQRRLKTTFSDFVWQCFQKSLFCCLFPKAQPRGSSKERGPYATAIF